MDTDQLIIERGPRSGETVELAERPMVIGRKAGVDIVIGDDNVSRQHARLTRLGDSYQIEDLGSLNGTFVNEQRLAGPHPLVDGDRVRLGPDVVLRLALAPRSPATVRMPAVSGAPKAPPAPAPVPAPAFNTPPAQNSVTVPTPIVPPAPEWQPAWLSISLPGEPPAEKALTGPELRLGRLDDNDIVVNLPIVSRHHLRLRQQGTGYVLVVEPNVANPVSINGAPVTGERVLQDNDQIVIGTPGSDQFVSFAYHAAEAPSPANANQTVRLSDRALAPPLTPPRAPVEDSGATRFTRPDRATQPLPANADQNKTMLGQAPALPEALPPELVVTNFGKPPALYTLDQDRLRIGRNPDNDIVLDNPFVSRYHAELRRHGRGYSIDPEPTVSNPIIVDGHVITESTLLQHGAKLRIGGTAPGEMVTLVYLSPADEQSSANQRVIEFSESKVLSIGRDKQNDIVLDAPSISRIHAQVERIGQRFRIKDLNSSNGTFVNGQAIKEITWVTPGDSIFIGPFRLHVGEQHLTQSDQSLGGMRVEARDLQKRVRKDLNVLQNISLVFEPKEFIVVVGQSGGGKSTLVDAIAGYRPATHGSVIVNETIDVYKNFDAIRATIGYVPQKDIIHMELTVFQALDYAAQLRMPADTSVAERHKRIDEVLDELDLAHRRDTQISQLSGGQQKRVSIGVELLNKPGLFFLDEPTSGLDPATETDLMLLMRRLADQGRTIILITHATKNVMLADRVVFLARGGYLAWFGPPDEALAYFDQFRSDRERRTEAIEFDNIYTLLDRKDLGTAANWAERYKQHPAYQKYIVQPLGELKPAAVPAAPARKQERPKRQSVSALRQFFILSARNIQILARDRATLGLMLILAPLMGSLDFVLAFGVGRNPFSYHTGDFNHVLVSLIMLTNTAILVGGLTMARELIKEREIYKRERMVNLHLSSYISSKLWFALLLALYQAFWFTLLRHLAFDMPGGWAERFYFFVTVFLMVGGGMMLGLFTSAVAPNANAAPLILTMFILPQVVLSGALVPLPDFISASAVSRWAFQGAIAISGMGSDVAADSCWVDKTAAQRKAMTREQKNSQCKCLGINSVKESSCKFPGLGQYYDPAIDAAAPVKPADPGPQPATPIFPDAPKKPANMQDPQALQAYLKALDDYNAQVTTIRDKFNADLKAYGATTDAYKTAITDYQTKETDYETSRATAIGSAEAVIQRFYTDYGWTFVNQRDREAYLGTLIKTWLAQLVIITVFLIGTVIAQRSQDVR